MPVTTAPPAPPGSAPRDRVLSEQVDAVMAAARVLVAVIAASVAQVEREVSLPELRVLVLASTRGSLTCAEVGAELGVHASNATRRVDRLVDAGLLHRRPSPSDRRYVEVTLTERGADLVNRVMTHRRRAVEQVLAAVAPRRRASIAPALAAFAAAGGEVVDGSVWPQGPWT